MSLLGNILGAVAAPFTGGASLIPTLIGGGLGVAKHFAVDKPQEERDRHLAAVTQRYSPWTGMQAGPIRQANLFGSVLQGAGAGAAAGKAMGGETPPAPGASEAQKSMDIMDAKQESMATPTMLQSPEQAQAAMAVPGWGANLNQGMPTLSPSATAYSPWNMMQKQPSMYAGR